MSLLNRPSAGLHNVLIALYRCVVAHGPMPRDRLLTVCGPADASETKAKMPQKTLNTWKNLGLFDVRADNSVRLAPDLPPVARDPEAGPYRLPQILRELVFHPRNNANLWGNEDLTESDGADVAVVEAPTGIRAADFTRGACWCMALRPRLPVESTVRKMWDGVDTLQQTTLDKANYTAFVNDTRWAGFAAWAPFLGLGWSSVAQALVLDPTTAVRQELSFVFGEEERLTQRAFLDGLAVRLPILDGGTYRTQVEEKLRPGMWEPPPAGGLSESLSLALQRLAVDGTLEVEDRADADRATLIGPGGRPIQTFSHVVMRRVKP